MRLLPILMPVLFWPALLAAIGWTAFSLIGLGVGEAYHPMAAKGDLLRPLRWAAPLAPVGVAIAVLLSRSSSERLYVYGLLGLVGSALIPFAPRIDSGYRQTYWLGDERYEIPWQYSPYNGSDAPGGTYFVMKLAPEGLVPRYDTGSETIIVSKRLAPGGRDASEGGCARDGSTMSCAWQSGNRHYTAWGAAALFPEDTTGLQTSIVALIDSFAVARP